MKKPSTKTLACHMCGAKLVRVKSDLPFKITRKGIIIFRDLPVLECSQCREFLIEDSVMAKVEKAIKNFSGKVELEIIQYAA